MAGPWERSHEIEFNIRTTGSGVNTRFGNELVTHRNS